MFSGDFHGSLPNIQLIGLAFLGRSLYQKHFEEIWISLSQKPVINSALIVLSLCKAQRNVEGYFGWEIFYDSLIST